MSFSGIHNVSSIGSRPCVQARSSQPLSRNQRYKLLKQNKDSQAAQPLAQINKTTSMPFDFGLGALATNLTGFAKCLSERPLSPDLVPASSSAQALTSLDLEELRRPISPVDLFDTLNSASSSASPPIQRASQSKRKEEESLESFSVKKTKLSQEELIAAHIKSPSPAAVVSATSPSDILNNCVALARKDPSRMKQREKFEEVYKYMSSREKVIEDLTKRNVHLVEQVSKYKSYIQSLQEEIRQLKASSGPTIASFSAVNH